jgi:hypothetical protein
MTFEIRYGLGGGFGGMGDWEDAYAKTLEEAELEAYERACELYESYEGMYGLRTAEEIMEEDDCSEDEAIMTYEEERESWLDYDVREKTVEK